jgi:hypothetical protein
VVDAMGAHVEENGGGLIGAWIVDFQQVAKGKIREKYWSLKYAHGPIQITTEKVRRADVLDLLTLVRECSGVARAAGEMMQARLAMPRGLDYEASQAHFGTCELATELRELTAKSAAAEAREGGTGACVLALNLGTKSKAANDRLQDKQQHRCHKIAATVKARRARSRAGTNL